jgi:hypothetical protein
MKNLCFWIGILFCNQLIILCCSNKRAMIKGSAIEFDSDDEQLSHKQQLSIPAQDVEPAVTSIGTIPDVRIHHEPQLKGGFAALAKKGTIRFTSYQDSSQK